MLTGAALNSLGGSEHGLVAHMQQMLRSEFADLLECDSPTLSQGIIHFI